MSQTYQTMVEPPKLPSIRDWLPHQSPAPQNITEPRVTSPVIKSDLIQRSYLSPESHCRQNYVPVSLPLDTGYRAKPRHEPECRSEDWISQSYITAVSPGYRSPQESVPMMCRGSSSPSTASTVTVHHGHVGSGMGSRRTKEEREHQKRSRHMKKERKRRYDIKYETDRLRGVPGCDNTTAKATVYKRSFEYITILEDTLYNMGGSVWPEFLAKVKASGGMWDIGLERTRISQSAEVINFGRM